MANFEVMSLERDGRKKQFDYWISNSCLKRFIIRIDGLCNRSCSISPLDKNLLRMKKSRECFFEILLQALGHEPVVRTEHSYTGSSHELIKKLFFWFSLSSLSPILFERAMSRRLWSSSEAI
jgi:hypothetical protein